MILKMHKKIAFVTQTTLSVDDTKDMIEILKERFPKYKRAYERRYLLRNN